MNANIQQLRYLIEIERTRSISQAAENLFIGQPNLSRIVKDMETGCGFVIFERTRKGVQPTEKGSAFLKHARNILREVEFMETLGPNGSQPGRFRICIPRSYTYMDMVQNFLASVQQPFSGEVRECHPRQAMEYMENGRVEIAVIRYSVQYQAYFSEQTQANSLSMHLLGKVAYSPVLRSGNPLAGSGSLRQAQLMEMTEVAHRDVFYPQDRLEANRRRVYAIDRMAQLQLLQNLPNAYLLSEPLPTAYLDTHGLVQLPCDTDELIYQDAVLYNPQCTISELENEFLHVLWGI